MVSLGPVHRDAPTAALALSVSTILVACRAPHEVELVVPDSIGFVALIDASGRSTPMVPWEPEALSAFFGDEPTWVLAYESSAFDGFELDGAVVEYASGCDATLPSPAWVAKYLDGELLEPTEAPPPVTTSWYRSSCPRLTEADISVDVDCRPDRCRPTLAEVEPCHYRVDLADCELFAFEAWRHPDGSICTELPKTPWTCANRSAPAVSVDSWTCVSEGATCGVDLFVDPPSPPFEVELFSVGPASDFLPPWFEFQNLLHPEMLAQGYVHDFVLVGDQIIASATDVPMLTCTPVKTSPSVLHSIGESGETRSSTAPPCLTRLAFDGQILGAFFHEGSWAFGRLSSTGAIEKSTPFDASVDFDMVTEILRLEDTWVVLVADLANTSKLYAFDADTLEPGPTPRLPNASWSACAIGGKKFALAVDRTRTVEFYEWPNERPFEVKTLPRRLGSDFDSVLGIACDEPNFWVSTTKRPHLISGRLGDPTLATPVIFDSTDDPVLPFRISDRELLVTSTGNATGAWTASIYRFDLERQRFWPGSVAVGRGILTRLERDTRGRVIGILPWDNRVVRIGVN